MARTGLVGGGILILGFGVFLFIVPISSLGTASDVHEACNSVFGQLGKALSSEISQRCQQVEYMSIGSYGLMGAGVLLIIIGAIYRN